MGMYKVYVKGSSTKIVKWLSKYGLEAVATTTVIDPSNHQHLMAIEIKNPKVITLSYTSKDVSKGGKKIATWQVVEDESIKGVAYLITPIEEVV